MNLFVLLLCHLAVICHGFSQNHSDVLNRLKYHETTWIKTSQMKFIDDSDIPNYPLNGKLEFDAFGKVTYIIICFCQCTFYINTKYKNQIDL